jgi:hypothetical protein
MALHHATGGVTQGGSWFTLSSGVLVPKFRGARVAKSAGQTANFSSETEISWGTEEADTDALWDAGTPNRFTIPASLNGRYANAQVSIELTSTDADTFKILALKHLNSSNTTLHVARQMIEAGGTTVYGAATLIGVPVSTGDYFIATLDEESDTSSTISNNANTGFAIEIR